MLTFSQLESTSSGIPQIAGCCPGTPAYADLCNESVRRILQYGNWWGSVVKYQGCIYGGCVVWPRQVDTVLATNLCRRNRPVVGGWYEFMQLNGGDISPNRSGGWLFGWGWGGGCHSVAPVTENDGTTPVFAQPPCGNDMYARFYPRCQNDIGKNVTIYGVDSNGQQITSLDANNNWIPGVVLTLALPFVSTSFLVRKIERVVKDITQCVVDGYFYDAVNNVLNDMAHYQPNETNPEYQHTLISNFGHCCSSTGTSPASPTPKTILAYVKLKHVDMVNPNDPCVVNSMSAIKLMVQSVKEEQDFKSEGSANLRALSLKELNLELRNKLPLDQVPVEVQSFGTATPRRHMIGRIL
jgi:hypothetical protein